VREEKAGCLEFLGRRWWLAIRNGVREASLLQLPLTLLFKVYFISNLLGHATSQFFMSLF
jgi:hypothetical protein